MLQETTNWFLSLEPGLQGAMIGAGTSLALGFFGFGSIWATAYANRRNSIKAEADRQRLEVYRDAMKVIEEASAGQRKAISFVQSTAVALRLRQSMMAEGSQPIPPLQRYSEFMAIHRAAGHGTSQLMLFLERWAIIEPRLKLFRFGFSLRSLRLLGLMSELSRLYADMLPFEAADGSTVSRTSAYPDEMMARLDDATQRYSYEAGLLDAYFGDLNVELQGLLLGHLFVREALERRDAPDPSQFTLRIDHYDQLMVRFQNEPEFKENSDLDAKLRKTHGTHQRRQWWKRR
jgi:hypothetical protein